MFPLRPGALWMGNADLSVPLALDSCYSGRGGGVFFASKLAHQTVTAKESLKVLSRRPLRFCDRATETSFFLHILCLALHLDICLSTVTRKSVVNLTWGDLENSSPAILAWTLVSYCFCL